MRIQILILGCKGCNSIHLLETWRELEPECVSVSGIVTGNAPVSWAFIGSLRCHYGDGNKNVKKLLVKISKTTPLHVHHAFFYISLPSLHDYDVNCLISRFIDNVNIRRRISLTLVYLDSFVKNSSPGEFANIKRSDRVGIVALKFHRSRSHFLRDVFAAFAVVVS